MKWELEEGGTLGEGYECAPVQYPRSDLNRGQSDNNKGGASQDGDVLAAVALNTTGNINVPRREGDVQNDVGPYPAVEIEQDEGDENGQA